MSIAGTLKKLNWRKGGQIFNPSDHRLPCKCKEFAQSPQVLELEDRLRVYFSARAVDQSGLYLSYPLYVDFEKDLSLIIDLCKHPVVSLGTLGSFDEHGIFPLNPLFENDHVLGFTCGWYRRESVNVDSAIGIVVSHDQGKTFKRLGQGPIVGPSLKEPYLLADPFVLKIDGVYHMWYVFGIEWIRNPSSSNPERVYKIGHAKSLDAISWSRSSRRILKDGDFGEQECQAQPTVFFKDKKYHMIFCFRHAIDFRSNHERSYRLGYAYSEDLIKWTRADDLLGIAKSDYGWDSEMMCYPFVLSTKDKVLLFYNGNQFGRYGFGYAELENYV